jgi:endonuclease/exonuclease/phosphatase family metal-dependent hydrolase
VTAEESTARGPGLRLMSYNIHSSRDDRRALAGVVRAERPDVVAVQEAPRRLRWRARNARLARDWDLLFAGGGLWALGNAVFTNHRVRTHDSWCVQFPLTPGRHLRGAVFVRCSIGRTRFVVVGTHLSLDAAERAAQARRLKNLLSEVDDPVLLAGDLNEGPGGAAWRTLATGLTDAARAFGHADAPTFSCTNPRTRIDAILVDPGCRLRAYRVVDSPLTRAASDHFPLVADVELPVRVESRAD